MGDGLQEGIAVFSGSAGSWPHKRNLALSQVLAECICPQDELLSVRPGAVF